MEDTTSEQRPDTTTQSPETTAISSTQLSDNSDSQQVTSTANISLPNQANPENQNFLVDNLHQSSSPQNQPVSTQTARPQSLLSRPPSYGSSLQRETRVAQQALFLPYVTQELPRYTEVGDSNSHHLSQLGEIQLGFVRQVGGQCVPIQIPGYISATTDEHPIPRPSHPPTIVQMVSYLFQR